MVLDTSALIAVLMNETGSPTLVDKLEKADSISISAASVVEAAIVMQAKCGDRGEIELDQLLHRLQAVIVPFDAYQSDLARMAYRKFGKGRHPASLNYGDCFSYALAKSLNEPLLCTGFEFTKTDVVVA